MNIWILQYRHEPMTWRRLVRPGVYSTYIRDLLIGEQYLLGHFGFTLFVTRESLYRPDLLDLLLPFARSFTRPSRGFLVKNKPQASQKCFSLQQAVCRNYNCFFRHYHCFGDGGTTAAELHGAFADPTALAGWPWKDQATHEY